MDTQTQRALAIFSLKAELQMLQHRLSGLIFPLNEEQIDKLTLEEVVQIREELRDLTRTPPGRR